jgi:hypothetical protein
MLIAQALGEYVATAALVETVNDAALRLEEVVGDWGTEGLMLLITAAMLWKVMTALR